MNVLIVDDQKDLTEILYMELTDAGYRCFMANDGDEAWDFIQKNSKIDVILSDYNMPKVDGGEFFFRLVNSNKDFPRFILHTDEISIPESILSSEELYATVSKMNMPKIFQYLNEINTSLV